MTGMPEGSTASEIALDDPFIGGFFALETPAPDSRGGLPALWGLDDTTPARDSAGAVFAALVRALGPPRIWLPGWLCAPFAAGLPADRICLYRVTPTLAPDTASLGDLAPGDLLLAVNPFGQTPGPDWATFVAAHPDTFFVEDCAQSLATGGAPWGDWQLYSPRKLMGVPEGGFLVPRTARARAITLPPATLPPDPERCAARLAPRQLRRDHPTDNGLWHPLYQQAESLGDNADRAIDPAAHGLLARIDPAPMIAARQRNAARLAAALPPALQLLPRDPAAAPFGLPLLLPRRDAILARLHRAGIFPAVHWRDILSPPTWEDDHARAASIVTLPCDHRYGPAQMDRLATTLLSLLPKDAL
jgi:hypothetical protein